MPKTIKCSEQSLDQRERKNIMKKANQAYTRLHNDAQAWQEEQQERMLWDSTLQDGLEDHDQCP